MIQVMEQETNKVEREVLVTRGSRVPTSEVCEEVNSSRGVHGRAATTASIRPFGRDGSEVGGGHQLTKDAMGQQGDGAHNPSRPANKKKKVQNPKVLVQAVRDRLKFIFGSVYEAFVFFDNNGSNIIDRTEFRRGLLQLEIIDPIEIEPREFVEMLMSEVDKGVRDGQIDCHEFINNFKWHPLMDMEEALMKLRVKRRHICERALSMVRSLSDKKQGVRIASEAPKTVEALTQVLQKIHDSEQFFHECCRRKKKGLSRFGLTSPGDKSATDGAQDLANPSQGAPPSPLFQQDGGKGPEKMRQQTQKEYGMQTAMHRTEATEATRTGSQTTSQNNGHYHVINENVDEESMMGWEGRVMDMAIRFQGVRLSESSCTCRSPYCMQRCT